MTARLDPIARRGRAKIITLAARRATDAGAKLHRHTLRIGAGAPTDADVLATLAELAEQTDALTRAYVETMRNDGIAWAAIGVSLGVTKQAAWQRFGRAPATAPARNEPTLFEPPAPDARSGYCQQRQHARCPGTARGRVCSCSCHGGPA